MSGHARTMARIPSLELRVRVRRDRGMLRWLGTSSVKGLRLRKDPMQAGRLAWQWVVDIDESLPALTEVLATCNGFLVDDDRGRAVGVVDRVVTDPEPSGLACLLIVQGREGQPIAVPVDDVLEVAPGTRRLLVRRREDTNR